MSKLKLGVIFGGMSTENEVSVASATSILNNLDREKYEIYPIYIGKNGIWYEYEEMGEKREFGQSVKQGDVLLFKASNGMKFFDLATEIQKFLS